MLDIQVSTIEGSANKDINIFNIIRSKKIFKIVFKDQTLNT